MHLDAFTFYIICTYNILLIYNFEPNSSTLCTHIFNQLTLQIKLEYL